MRIVDTFKERVAAYLDRCSPRNPPNVEVALHLGVRARDVWPVRKALGRPAERCQPNRKGKAPPPLGKSEAIDQIRADWTPELLPVSISMPPDGCEQLGRDSRMCASIYPRRGATYCEPCAARLKAHHAARNAIHYPTAGSKPAPRTEV